MRRADADARLTAFARSWLGRAFAWGRCDCTMLAAHAIDAQAETQLASFYVGLWHDEASARGFQAAFDGDIESVLRGVGLVDALGPGLALEERLRLLVRGDLILARLRGFYCAHAVFGALSMSADPARGIVWCPTAELLAWPRALVLRVP